MQQNTQLERSPGNNRKIASVLIKRLPLEKLLPHPRNPRKHPSPGTQEWQQLRQSLDYDYFDPIVWNKRNGQLVSGHLRKKVLEEMGITHADVVVVDYDDQTHVARMIWANEQAGRRDDTILDGLLRDLRDAKFDLSFTGLSISEIDSFFSADQAKDAPPEMDLAEQLNKEWKVCPGDLFLVGPHRLLCADCEAAPAVKELLFGESPSLMVTDPPYGVEYNPEWRRAAGVSKNFKKMRKVANDAKADWRAAYALFPGDVAYVWHAGKYSSIVQQGIEAVGFETIAQIIWSKDRFALSRGDYHWKHEPAWYSVRKGANHAWAGARDQCTIWEIPSREDTGHGHGTQKPLECMLRPLRNHRGDVYDPFLGSGTTMVAAQNLGRRCFAMELDPSHCAVILQRMRAAFGVVGERVATKIGVTNER